MANLLIEKKSQVAYWTLNRPEKRNALSRDLLAELAAACAQTEADSDVRVIVLTANGPVFSSGHDLKEMTGCTKDAYHDLFALCSHVMLGLRRLPQPVIARVHGM